MLLSRFFGQRAYNKDNQFCRRRSLLLFGSYPLPPRFAFVTLATLLQIVLKSQPIQAGFSSYSSFGSMSHNVERDGSDTITVSPRNEGDQSALVVICHGLGDTSEGFADVAEVSAVHISALTGPTHDV